MEKDAASPISSSPSDQNASQNSPTPPHPATPPEIESRKQSRSQLNIQSPQSVQPNDEIQARPLPTHLSRVPIHEPVKAVNYSASSINASIVEVSRIESEQPSPDTRQPQNGRAADSDSADEEDMILFTDDENEEEGVQDAYERVSRKEVNFANFLAIFHLLCTISTSLPAFILFISAVSFPCDYPYGAWLLVHMLGVFVVTLVFSFNAGRLRRLDFAPRFFY